MEGGISYTGYNNVKIPDDSGTKFSLKDDIPQKKTAFYRIKIGYNFNKNHSIFILIAPLRIKGEGQISKEISFNGTLFSSSSYLKSLYRFDSYRLTYQYIFYENNNLLFGAGFTAKIRDAEIKLEDEFDNYSSKKNTGFVPLIHLKVNIKFSSLLIILERDGLITPMGRAEDFLFGVGYNINQNFTIRVGYRVLEGGSEGGGGVYTFSMFHYVGLGISLTF